MSKYPLIDPKYKIMTKNNEGVESSVIWSTVDVNIIAVMHTPPARVATLPQQALSPGIL